MIEISVRNCARFIEVIIRQGDASLDLGLQDADDAEGLMNVLEEAVDDLRDFVESSGGEL